MLHIWCVEPISGLIGACLALMRPASWPLVSLCVLTVQCHYYYHVSHFIAAVSVCREDRHKKDKEEQRKRKKKQLRWRPVVLLSFHHHWFLYDQLARKLYTQLSSHAQPWRRAP